jgi:ankyrin repeat protein
MDRSQLASAGVALASCRYDSDGPLDSQLRIFQRLVTAHPEGLSTKDNEGRIPLHAASAYGDLDLFRAALQAYPEGAAVADNFGKLPIHHALGGKTEITRESAHPYSDHTRSDYTPVELIGATSFMITFDEQSATEQNCDYLTTRTALTLSTGAR